MLTLHLASRGRHGLTGFSVRHSVDHHHALMAKADATIHPTGVFLLLGPSECPPTRCHEDGRDGLAFVGDKLFAVHFDLEGFSSLDPFLYSSIHHPNFIPSLFFRSTLAQ
jgi:hypothetical protein